MIVVMRRLWTDKLIRISGGLALLLLLVVQEKICPWLPTTPAARPASARQPQASNESPPGKPSAFPSEAEARLAAGSSGRDDPTAPHAPTGSQSPNKRSPSNVGSVLLDATPIRWYGVPGRAALEETLGRRDGAVARGPLAPPAKGWAPALVAALPAPYWLASLFSRTNLGLTRPWTAALSIRDPAVKTILLRTGPPHA
jgi:hypothetical protein